MARTTQVLVGIIALAAAMDAVFIVEAAAGHAGRASGGRAAQARRTSANGAPNQLGLVTVPGTKCLDGTTAGYYFAPGAAGSTQWVVYLQGGGACVDQWSCNLRLDSPLGSSANWSDTINGDSFYSADPSVNPGFFGANKVFVPYCTGDVHAGQVTAASSASLGFVFSGHSNLALIVQHLQGGPLATATKLLLTGESAGGFGSFLNVDWLQSVLPGVSVKAVPIAGWFFPGDAAPPNPSWAPPSVFPLWQFGWTTSPGTYLNITRLWNMYLHPKCTAAQPAEKQFHCSTVHVLYPYIDAPVFVLENQFDSEQIFVELQAPYNLTIPAVRQYIQYFGNAMRNSTRQVVNAVSKKDGLFLAGCLHHNVATNVVVQGHTYMTPVVNWYFETGSLPRIMTDDCSGLPCNPQCKL